METYFILESVDLCFSSFTHHAFPLDVRLLLHNSSGSDTFCVRVLCIPIRDPHRMFEIRCDKVPIDRVIQSLEIQGDRRKTHETVPSCAILAFVGSSHGLLTTTRSRPSLSLTEVERLPMGRIPNRLKGMLKTVMYWSMSTMSSSGAADMVRMEMVFS